MSVHFVSILISHMFHMIAWFTKIEPDCFAAHYPPQINTLSSGHMIFNMWLDHVSIAGYCVSNFSV